MSACAPGLSPGLVGESPQIVHLRRLIEKASRNRLPVLLLGDSGTGKEVVARAIHAAAPQGQFVPIDCGSLVGTLMESELFGHVKGSFSGASENKKGLVELADGGTAFFDEIGDLPLEFQTKLLRLIQEHQFRPVGGLKWHSVDFRVVAATHRNLKAEVAAKRFREDLYYRLNVFVIHLPPLCERKQDIPLLIEHFLEGHSELRPGADVLKALLDYDWPGNVRELKNCIERMTAMHTEGGFQTGDLPSALQYGQAALAAPTAAEISRKGPQPEFVLAPKSPVISLPECERRAIGSALAATHGDRGRAAGLLQIGRTTLYRKMKQYGIA